MNKILLLLLLLPLLLIISCETDEDDASNSIPANWDLDEGPEPEINYSGIVLTFGIRSVFFQ